MRSSFLIFETGSPNALFCGDTLFVGGCGRFFEGTGDDMVKTFDLFKKLDPYTEIFCGHEYTLDNLKFALTVSKSKAKKRAMHRVYGKHCRLTFLFLFPVSNLFHCLGYVLLYFKTPKTSLFFNPINIFDSFTHCVTVF